MKHLIFITIFFECFLAIIITSCSKDETLAPSIYNIKVVDYYSNEPIENVQIVLKGPYYQNTLLGSTNSDGKFSYTYDKTTTQTGGTQRYEIYVLNENIPFVKPDERIDCIEHFPVNYTNKTSEVTIKMHQNTTLCITSKRVSADPLNLGNRFCGVQNTIWNIDSCHQIWTSTYPAIFNDTLNQVNINYYSVPSDRLIDIKTRILYDCVNINQPNYSASGTQIKVETIMTNYHDTIFYNIDY